MARERTDQRRDWRRAGSYSSKLCRWCGRDYLYPAYGGWAICHDCLWTHQDRPRQWVSGGAHAPGVSSHKPG